MADQTESEAAEGQDGAAGRPTLGGIPTVTAEESVQVDEFAIKDGLSLDGMVNRAAFLTCQILEEGLLEQLVGKPIGETAVTVLAGTGNKGAAALGVGKRLMEGGATLNVVLARKAAEYSGLGKSLLSDVEKGAKKVYSGYNERAFDQADLLIDGLIGAGLEGTPRASVSLLIKGANFSMKPTIALDIPSGLNATTGIQSPVTVKAAATMVVGLPKRGMLGSTNLSLCGDVYVLDVGVPAGLWKDHLDIDTGTLFGDGDWVHLQPDSAQE